MARSWERMVQKNKNQLNKQRKKQGKSSISSFSDLGSVVSGDTFKGRKIALPVVLVLLACLYGLLGVASSTVNKGEGINTPTMTWLIMGAYILLGVIIYFRRPYLLVGKDTLQTTRLNRVRNVSATSITNIKVAKGSVVIEQKGKGGNWVFTRLINRYDIQAMGVRLEEFAKANNIPFEK
ncbi:hypothetical protein [Paenibacillus glacialis]|uniref:Methyltransferase n=1 Tax=Paenibacillus glacialis TaxID=494026 RepID=A0A168MCV2_9BACL|nr:hypothetical protein [Paenibacillus glacialis]OAB44522.1 hypothetical protein PGLA_07670 [Paenibacillus glacialis]